MTKQELQAACRLAANQIQKDGLAKDGTYGEDHGPKCAIGALRYVTLGSVDRHLVLEDNQLKNLFKEARPRTRRDDIVQFNDADRTRKHDVVELLRDMAAV